MEELKKQLAAVIERQRLNETKLDTIIIMLLCENSTPLKWYAKYEIYKKLIRDLLGEDETRQLFDVCQKATDEVVGIGTL